MNNFSSNPSSTHDRLIEAATEVFSGYGLTGATTREIARIASVNEVTLFRHFQNKEQLLLAVIEKATATQVETLSSLDEWTMDLRKDLEHYGQIYNQMLEDYEALIRTFIGEARRHPEGARKLLSKSTQLLRKKLIDYLQSAISLDDVRTDVDLGIAIDIFTGMLLAGMLRRSAMPDLYNYDRKTYLNNCIDLFVRAIATPSYINKNLDNHYEGTSIYQ